MSNIFLLQLNTSLFLQTIGLSVITAIFQAPVYALAVYWGIKLATKNTQNIELNELRNKLRMEKINRNVTTE